MVKIWRSSYFCGIFLRVQTSGVALDPLWDLSPYYILCSVGKRFKWVFNLCIKLVS
jgi:hypothetical protein